MRVTTCLIALAALATLVSVCSPAQAELPENYLKRWDDPAVQKRIDDGIEKNRKSDAVLTIVDAAGKPVADAEVKITQKSHEFLFGCNIFVLGQMKEKNQGLRRRLPEAVQLRHRRLLLGRPRTGTGQTAIRRGKPLHLAPAAAGSGGRVRQEARADAQGPPACCGTTAPTIPSGCPRIRTNSSSATCKRFREIAERYAKDIPIWDGVNESLVCSADYPLFSAENRTHPPYVPWAFTEEQKVFRPENLLMINDVTSFNWPANETNRFYQQCTKLLEDGIGIEGIGFQFHFFSRKSLDGYLNGDRCDPGTLLDTYEMFAKFGLPLWITEITIGSAGDDGLAIQDRVVRDIYRLWFASPKMAGITWWNLGDGTAYGNEGVAGGGLADDDFNPKPAYKALDQLINHDWKTNLETKSDADGNVKFRGFHGRYEIQVTADGKTKKFEMTVGSDGPAKETLTMP